MKKIILIEIILIAILVILIASNVCFIDLAIQNKKALNELNNDLTLFNQTLYDSINSYFIKYIIYSIFSALACIADLAIIVLIAIKDFPCFKPLLDKLNAHKQAHQAALADKAEADKQARIAKLESELEELKKN